MAARVLRYSTVLPSTARGWRVGLGTAGSIVLHVVLLVLLVERATRHASDRAAASGMTETVQPIQLVFAPPRPAPTPREPAPEVPVAAPFTPGPDQTPGSDARVAPVPESDPNTAPNTPRTEATRPDPGQSDRVADASSPAPPAGIAAAPLSATSTAPTLESEAQRLFGRPSTKLGPVAGTRDNRPWETPVELSSRGCTLPPSEAADSSLPPGMGVIAGRIYNERTGEPLAGARLQILGTPYGAFSDSKGQYRLVFDRSLVDRCRSQAVRVTAPGYQGRDVMLYIGERPNGDVPLSRF